MVRRGRVTGASCRPRSSIGSNFPCPWVIAKHGLGLIPNTENRGAWVPDTSPKTECNSRSILNEIRTHRCFGVLRLWNPQLSLFGVFPRPKRYRSLWWIFLWLWCFYFFDVHRATSEKRRVFFDRGDGGLLRAVASTQHCEIMCPEQNLLLFPVPSRLSNSSRDDKWSMKEPRLRGCHIQGSTTVCSYRPPVRA